ncbi:MAG: 2-dehydropantoate 2-reductase, partial [Planctomycetes bacterium]|nr:2-dehydropantoate 2-reductase [Planctomycetota bacterium]
MRIAIVGSGALGGFYGAMLARQGFEVHFLMRRFYESVRRDGLQVKSVLGDFHLEKVNCYDRTEDIPAVDLVFIGL